MRRRRIAVLVLFHGLSVCALACGGPHEPPARRLDRRTPAPWRPPNDWRVDTSASSLAAYREVTASSAYQGQMP
jgi:hypothetical protein